ncbi:hypothetical protein [Oryzihumus leptocrescens]|nr:hypothetical protein [Oryzihumus leptocrescens]
MHLDTAPPAPMATVFSLSDDILAKGAPAQVRPVGHLSASDVMDALTWLSGYLAQVHGDFGWLCSKPGASSPTKEATSAETVGDLFAGKAGDLLLNDLEPRLASDKLDCSAVTPAAPGVVVGPQSMTVTKDPLSADLIHVAYRGRFGYRLKDRRDATEALYAADFRVDYALGADDSGWHIWWVDQNYRRFGSGWMPGVPLPAGFGHGEVVHPLPDASEEAASAVRVAVSKTLAQPGATWTHARDFAPVYGARGTTTMSGPVALDAGTASLADTADPTASELIFDHGKVDLSPVTVPISAVPGEAIPKGAKWRAWDPASSTVQGWGDDTSPFVALSLLRQASSAAVQDCSAAATKVKAIDCYRVRVPAATAAYSGGLTTREGWWGLSHGLFAFDVDLGTDTEGRLVWIGRHFQVASLGKVVDRVDVSDTLTDFAGSAPTAPPRPPESQIAEDGAYYLRNR